MEEKEIIYDKRPAMLGSLNKFRIAARVVLLLDHILLLPYILLFVVGVFRIGILYVPVVLWCGFAFVLSGSTKMWFLRLTVGLTFVVVAVYMKKARLNDDYDKGVFLSTGLYIIELAAFLYWMKEGFLPT